MSSFGKIFKITTFGESHSDSVGVTIENCPPNFCIFDKDIQYHLDRRRPGQTVYSTDRKEDDKLTILCGLEDNKTLGTPITAVVKNTNIKPQDYKFSLGNYIPRPSHADFTYLQKYKIHARSGGGRSSARETIGRVIGGAIALKWLKQYHNIEIIAWVSSVGPINYSIPNYLQKIIDRTIVDTSPIRCPDITTSKIMGDYILDLKNKGNSTGGTIMCICRNVPTGLGEPCFDKLEAQLSHAMLSIPSTKAFEIGSGFEGTKLTGYEHNDLFDFDGSKLFTQTNNSGGVQGGISNGSDIIFKVGFKPPATISLPQKTANLQGNKVILEATGRHDPCVVNRAVCIVESMAALVIIDNLLIQKTRNAFI